MRAVTTDVTQSMVIGRTTCWSRPWALQNVWTDRDACHLGTFWCGLVWDQGIVYCMVGSIYGRHLANTIERLLITTPTSLLCLTVRLGCINKNRVHTMVEKYLKVLEKSLWIFFCLSCCMNPDKAVLRSVRLSVTFTRWLHGIPASNCRHCFAEWYLIVIIIIIIVVIILRASAAVATVTVGGWPVCAGD